MTFKRGIEQSPNAAEKEDWLIEKQIEYFDVVDEKCSALHSTPERQVWPSAPPPVLWWEAVKNGIIPTGKERVKGK